MLLLLHAVAVIAIGAYIVRTFLPLEKGFFINYGILAVVSVVIYYIYSYLHEFKRYNDLTHGKYHEEMEKERLRIAEIEKSFNEKNRVLEETKNAIEILTQEKTKGFPWLAQAYADYYSLRDEEVARYLEKKSRPAITAAETVRQVKSEKRELMIENKKIRYIIEYYESLFPWLIDFKDIEDDDIASIGSDHTIDSTEDMARNWLTDSEYNNLSTVEKYQKALDRFLGSKKTKWQIGRDFERYVGYTYEKKGYSVEYRGIIDGYEDLGRDLICKLSNKIMVVQCKYWSQNKVIHEKHINQLLGTTIMYYYQTQASSKASIKGLPKLIKGIIPVFVTSTHLSEMAKKFAETLGVEVHEGISLGQYPIIKCNINPRTSEKIYHLPFDQQYDKTQVKNPGEFYAWTVKEAEDKGFRRALRWHGSDTSIE